MNSPFAPSGKCTVLVVDDTPDNLSLMSDLLRTDYKVKLAPSGERALQIVAGDSKPDLILLDIMMPDMDGYEVLRRLQFNPDTEDIPVIFLTAMSAAEDESIGLELGAVDYLDRQRALQVALLSGTKISVEDDDAGLRGPRELCEFLNLATADQGGSFRGGPRLDDVLDHGGSGALRQRRKLFQGLFGRVP